MEQQSPTITDVMTSSERLTNLQLDLLNKHNLAWSVIPEPLISLSGRKTKHIALFRSDTGEHVGTHTNRYHPAQNAEIAKLLIYAASPIDELDLKGTRGGVFQNGRKVYFQIPLPQVTIGNTQVLRYLTAINSHDGSSSVALGTCQTVVVCQNTFWKAYNSGIARVNHTSTMQAKLEKLTDKIHETIKADAAQVEHFRRMTQTSINAEMIGELRKTVFKYSDSDEHLPTKKENRIAKFDAALDIELAEQGYNAWGLFNAVTRYTNHNMRPTTTSDAKLANVVMGTGARINDFAYSYISDRMN